MLINTKYLLFSQNNEHADISYVLDISLLSDIDMIEDFFNQLKIITEDEYINYEIILPEIYHKIKTIVPKANLFVQNFYKLFTSKSINKPIEEFSRFSFPNDEPEFIYFSI